MNEGTANGEGESLGAKVGRAVMLAALLCMLGAVGATAAYRSEVAPIVLTPSAAAGPSAVGPAVRAGSPTALGGAWRARGAHAMPTPRVSQGDARSPVPAASASPGHDGAADGAASRAAARQPAPGACALPGWPQPRCSIVLFIHIPKTGGTSMRTFVMNQPGFTYHFLHAGGGCNRRGRADLVAQALGVDWACLLEQLTTNRSFVEERPRLILEVHGGFTNSTRLALQLRAAADSPPMRALGCVTTSFALVRSPLKFLVSNLQDSFKHSWFKREYAALASSTGPRPAEQPRAQPRPAPGKPLPLADYRNGALHEALPRWLPRLVDAQTRQVYAYAEGRPTLANSAAPIRPQHVAAVRRFLAALDVLGVTERGSESMLLLMRRAGLPNYRYHIAGANDAIKTFVRKQRPGWPAQEAPLVAAVVNGSAHDRAMEQLAAARLDRAVAAGGAQLACELRLLRNHTPLVNPRYYPCVDGLVNDPQTPWARCIPRALCGRAYAPACRLDWTPPPARTRPPRRRR